MRFLDTKHERKSATITILLGLLILFLIFTFGLTYFDPPKEFGIAVNFGTTDFGSGNVQPKEALKPASQEESIEEEVVEEKAVEEPVEPSSASSEAAEDVITQNNEEAIAIKKREEAKRKEEAKLEEARKEEIRKQEEIDRKAEIERERVEKEKQEKAAKRKKTNDLVGVFSDGDGNADGGEGDDNKSGDIGQENGDPIARGHYGTGGGGSGGNYQLGNRKALSNPKPNLECSKERGTVIVEIFVDRNGKVISANARNKGTTIIASCLLDQAENAARKTIFEVDKNAPQKQMGSIIYRLSYK